ncbi:MAG: MFS transporter [Microbacteriaceae bacterium]
MNTSATFTPALHKWRLSVYITFASSGVAFASWVTRTPDIRELLQVSNSQIGLIIFGLSAGSMIGLFSSGTLISRFGAKPVIAAGASLIGLGIAVVGVGTTLGVGGIMAVSAGMALTGVGFGLAEVALNVEGAALEAAFGRSVLPSLHGSYSLGALAGSGLGALAQLFGVPVVWHLAVLGIAAIIAPLSVLHFLPRATGRESRVPHSEETQKPRGMVTSRSRLSVWLEPRTLLIGLIVLGMAFAEGAANDWLPLALVDGYEVEPAIASACFIVFIAAMAAGRLLGGTYVDRFGRVSVLRFLAVVAAVGVLLVILSGNLLLVTLGCALWGVGVSLGFPLGVSAASDNPINSAARVSVVSTIGYFAFLVGPPVLGYLAEYVTLLQAFWLVFALIVVAGLLSHFAQPLAGSATNATNEASPHPH